MICSFFGFCPRCHFFISILSSPASHHLSLSHLKMRKTINWVTSLLLLFPLQTALIDMRKRNLNSKKLFTRKLKDTLFHLTFWKVREKKPWGISYFEMVSRYRLKIDLPNWFLIYIFWLFGLRKTKWYRKRREKEKKVVWWLLSSWSLRATVWAVRSQSNRSIFCRESRGRWLTLFKMLFLAVQTRN